MQRACLRQARRYCRRPEDAEEVAQEAALRAWRHRAKVRDPQRALGWLAQIVRNEAVRHAERESRAPANDLVEREAAEDPRLLGAAARVDLRAALASLDPRERQLVVLRYAEDLTQEAIARLLGVPEGTVKVQLHRARTKLRRALEQ